jgi:hypothetical protein
MRKLPLKNLPETLPLAISYYGPYFCADYLFLAIVGAGISWENWLKDGEK